MDVLAELAGGFVTALSLTNLLYALVGCPVGTLVGVLPGIGPVAGVALLIPLTLNLDATGAIIMLAAIVYGTTYGGTITSVLLNTPGEAASAITTIDGYQMTKRGRAGSALTIAALGSFVGGTVATVLLVVAARPLGSLGLRIGPPEFFALVLVGLALLVALAGRSIIRAMISGVIGLLIAMVGIDPVAGAPRFTFGESRLLDVVSFVAVVVGLFGLSEVLTAARQKIAPASAPSFRSLLPSGTELRRSTPAIGRGTVIGSLLGLIPASPTIAVLMGAFLQQGLSPGPSLFVEDAPIAWAIIASLFIGNVILLLLNVPLVGLWTSILKIPYPILAALILMFLVVGAYTINFTTFDVFVMIGAGVLGLAMRRLDIPLAPLVLTLVLGPLMERSLRESLEISLGDPTVFLTRPISAVLIVIAAVIVLSPLLKLRKPRVLVGDHET